jgi:hypothetical protein
MMMMMMMMIQFVRAFSFFFLQFASSVGEICIPIFCFVELSGTV